MSTWKHISKLIRFCRKYIIPAILLEFIGMSLAPQLIGLAIQNSFNVLSGGVAVAMEPWAFFVLFAVIALFRNTFVFLHIPVSFRVIFMVSTLLRKNIINHILERPAANAIEESPGDIVSRFRGDVETVAMFVMAFGWITGSGFFVIIAVAYMLKINSTITLIVIIPLLSVYVITRAALSRIEKYRKDARETTGKVTGFIGEIFKGVARYAEKTLFENVFISRCYTQLNRRDL